MLLLSSLVMEGCPFLVIPEGQEREGDPISQGGQPRPPWGMGTEAEKERGERVQDNSSADSLAL